MEKDWIKLRTYSDTIRAEISKQMLEENGIATVLLNKQDSSFKIGKIDLFVNKADEEIANQLIEETQSEDWDED